MTPRILSSMFFEVSTGVLQKYCRMTFAHLAVGAANIEEAGEL